MDFLWILIGTAFLCLIVLSFFVARRWRRGISQRDRRLICDAWASVATENHRRSALLEADKLVDLALKKRGYRGTMADKLRRGGRLFSDTDSVWQAHKMRNRVAHEIGFEPSEKEFRRAISSFKTALKDLGIPL